MSDMSDDEFTAAECQVDQEHVKYYDTAVTSGGKIIALYNVKLFLTHISVQVAQIKKLKKADWHFFAILV